MPQMLHDYMTRSNNTVMLLILVALSVVVFGAFVLAGYEGQLLTSIPPQVASTP